MIWSLPFTVLVEGLVVAGYASWQRKPASALLLASVIVNLFTQSGLWLVLNLAGSRAYLPTLFAAELLIWPLEAWGLYIFPGGRLNAREALLLSLAMNTASFTLGWFMPF